MSTCSYVFNSKKLIKVYFNGYCYKFYLWKKSILCTFLQRFEGIYSLFPDKI